MTTQVVGKSRYPGPRSQTMIDELQRYVVMNPQPFVVDLEHSQGMYLATVDGQRLFDWAGYYASKLLGHNHPALSDPAYVHELALAANNKVANPDFLTPQCLAYYRLLHELAPQCMRNAAMEVYAVNSGAEAVENMMKYMINLHDEKMIERRRLVGVRRFIYFENAFHGRTVFALNITQLDHAPIITEDYHGLVSGNIEAPFPAWDHSQSREQNMQRTQQALTWIDDALTRYAGEVVGIIVEPIQGAGGHRVADKSFFQGLSQLAHRHDVYLGFDEVQTAGGQTGSMFTIDQFDLPHPPQAVATAKKFANGVVYMRHTMMDRGVLDSTWGGNLADMVRFVREIQVIRDQRLIEQVPEKTEVLTRGLSALAEKYAPLIFNVRGIGLYQGFSLHRPEHTAALCDIALEREDMFLLSAGPQSIRLRPPITVTIDEIKLFIEKLARCFDSLAA